ALAERVADRHIYEAQLRIDRRGLPNAAAVALAAHPGRPGNVPALILLILRDRVELPLHLAGLGVDRQDVPARNMALTARAADVERAVVELRRGREPVAHADRRLRVGIAWRQDVHDHARLTVLAEALQRRAGLGVE